MRHVSAVVAALLLSACGALASQPAEPALELTGRVVDQAELIDSSIEDQLIYELERIESETGVQFVVATTDSLGGLTVDAYSLQLANAWGLGSAERNDGLLLLVAPNERKVRIEVGLGLEQHITDEEAAQILEEHVLPAFSQDNFEGGIFLGVEHLKLELTAPEMKEAA